MAQPLTTRKWFGSPMLWRASLLVLAAVSARLEPDVDQPKPPRTPVMAWQQLGELVRRAEASAETEPVESLRLLLAAEALCASLADQAVTKARNQGVTWEDIAEASGQSRQAAWRRWRNRISNT